LEPVSLHLIDEELPKEPVRRERSLYDLNDRIGALLGSLGPFDFLYERFSLWACAGVEFARSNDIPGLLEVNAPLVEEQMAHRTLVDYGSATRTAKRAFAAANAVLAVSADVARHACSYGIHEHRVHILPNAVNPQRFEQRRRAARRHANREFVIGFVGSLKPWHGVDQLIGAYEKLWTDTGRWQLVIVGDGPDRERLETLVRALQPDIASTIKFLGAAPHAAIPPLLSTFDAAVAPGVTGDTYFSPLKLFEYMAAGLPIVAAQCGQMQSLIQHGRTGLLYTPGDIDSLADSLRKLRAEPRMADCMGGAARREVVAHHTWQHRCETILSIVRQSFPICERVAI
jgi:glycosyltransferase involved in cell wall biosynthesis